jgi:DNA-binding NarL/FixJ family response regulator
VSVRVTSQRESRPIKLLLVDDDPIFRLGLSTALQAFSDFQVVAQADSSALALTQLSQEIPDIVILEPKILDGWQLCQQIHQDYLNLSLFLLSATSDTEQLLAARSSGVSGYSPKGTEISELVEILRQIYVGEKQWQALDAIALNNTPIRRKNWLVRTYQSGLEQIETTITQINSQLNTPGLSMLDWLFLSGRKRELLTSRWLLEQLLPSETIVIQEPSVKKNILKTSAETFRLPSLLPAIAPANLDSQRSPSLVVLDNILAKIKLGIENKTNLPLEIDILQADKKQELFYLILTRFRKILEELRLLNVIYEELPEKRSLVLRSLLESSLLDFLSNYYTLIDLNNAKIINIFSLDSIVIQEEILEPIPMVVDLLGYFLLENSLVIDNVPYRPESPETMARAEILLENLIHKIANAVMQVILNNFSEVEIIKQTLYNDRYLSSREIARFRNDISWQYRQDKYLEEPKNIFESKHRLFILNGGSLKTIYIYASRQDELTRLRGIPWLTTIAFELRDALSPRLRSIVSFLGKIAVYLLTQVIGRAIGLIGRGIIQGVGNTLQDTRYGKNSDRGK